MSVQQFLLACSHFQGEDQTFSKLLVWAFENLGVQQRDLAHEFQVSPSSISRWAAGIAFPHPRIQKLVLTSLKRRVPKQMLVEATVPSPRRNRSAVVG